MIVNVSSISADGGYPYTSLYQAFRAAVASLSEGLHAELAEFDVQVKALHPGSHETRIFSKVDRAQDVPADYDAGWASFASLNLVRSDPAGTAEVMFRMSPTETGAGCTTTPAPTASRCRRNAAFGSASATATLPIAAVSATPRRLPPVSRRRCRWDREGWG